MLITVTQEHIDKGKDALQTLHPGECCPIAQAIMDRFKVNSTKVTRVSVEYIGLFPEAVILDHPISIPITATDWINNFDAQNPVTPFTFELDLGSGV